MVASRAELRAWLAAHHTRATGVWLVTYKRADPDRYLAYDAIAEECPAFGWIDSLPRAKDAARSMLRIAPRKPGSNWSKANKDHIARLEAAGPMTEAGRRMVDLARTDGGWPRSTPSRLWRSLPTSPPPAVPQNGPKPRILLAEDNEVNQDLIRLLLIDLGHDVVAIDLRQVIGRVMRGNAVGPHRNGARSGCSARRS